MTGRRAGNVVGPLQSHASLLTHYYKFRILLILVLTTFPLRSKTHSCAACAWVPPSFSAEFTKACSCAKQVWPRPCTVWFAPASVDLKRSSAPIESLQG